MPTSELLLVTLYFGFYTSCNARGSCPRLIFPPLKILMVKPITSIICKTLYLNNFIIHVFKAMRFGLDNRIECHFNTKIGKEKNILS